MKTISLNIDKENIFICHKKANNEFTEPVLYRANVRNVGTEYRIISQGISSPKTILISQTKDSNITEIKEMDRCYYRKPIPKMHDKTQTKKTGANYLVTSVVENKNTINITMQIIEGR